MSLDARLRVLVVDDSAVTRAAIARILDRAPDLEVVGMALDGLLAQRKTLRLLPDVITLDVDMPGMDGFAFLDWLKEHRPTPTVVVTGAVSPSAQDTVLRLLEAGAVDVVPKPTRGVDLAEVERLLVERVRAAAGARVRRRPPASPATTVPTETPAPPLSGPIPHDLIVIGASTGGPLALTEVLSRLPATAPPVLVVQHMPASFMPRFTARLNDGCAVEVKLAEHREQLRRGVVLVSPGDVHMAVTSFGGTLRVELRDGPRLNHQRPAVDVLFLSAAEAVGRRACGVLMTGMGRDGAEGLLALHRQGARTIGQDEASSAVYGMAREAARLGAVQREVPLGGIAAEILRAR